MHQIIVGKHIITDKGIVVYKACIQSMCTQVNNYCYPAYHVVFSCVYNLFETTSMCQPWVDINRFFAKLHFPGNSIVNVFNSKAVTRTWKHNWQETELWLLARFRWLGMAPTTLDDAMTAVPQLQSSCILALNDEAAPAGFGIKLLRLVSKHFRKVMQGDVQGYTLHLDGSGSRHFNQMDLCQGVNLASLRILVTAAPNPSGSMHHEICRNGLLCFVVWKCHCTSGVLVWQSVIKQHQTTCKYFWNIIPHFHMRKQTYQCSYPIDDCWGV